MKTTEQLKARTVKDLAAMAKKKKVPGWHAMRKDELVRALVRRARAEAVRRAKAACEKPAKASGNGAAKGSNGCKLVSPHAQRRLQQIKAKLAEAKDLSFRMMSEQNGHAKDRLVVMVRDPYWLHAYWELGRRSIERAEAAMGQYWHGARPILRLSEVSRDGTTSSARKTVRDIDIHGGVNNWYIDVQDPPKSYQLEIGYLAPGGRFFCVARSNIVSTPAATGGDAFDSNWKEVAKDFDRIYALSAGGGESEPSDELKEVFEQRLRRPMGDPMTTQFGPGAAGIGPYRRNFNFAINTELIVHGATDPGARVTLRGQPVPLRKDGTFAVRFNLTDRRHVLPVVASTHDGAEQRTIVLAVDHNTKVMEPVIRDPGD